MGITSWDSEWYDRAAARSDDPPRLDRVQARVLSEHRRAVAEGRTGSVTLHYHRGVLGKVEVRSVEAVEA